MAVFHNQHRDNALTLGKEMWCCCSIMGRFDGQNGVANFFLHGPETTKPAKAGLVMVDAIGLEPMTLCL